MGFVNKHLLFVSILLTFSMLFSPFIQAEELSIFQKLKLKALDKIEQYKTADYWIVKSTKKVASVIGDKTAGIIGGVMGLAIGAALGAPALGAGIGALVIGKIGSNIASSITEIVTKDYLEGDRDISLSSFTDAAKSISGVKLSADTVGSIVGDIFGTMLGAVAGSALMACGGSIVLPIIGCITFSAIGGKIGKSIGKKIGKWLGKTVFNKGYEVLTGIDPNADIEIENLDESEDAVVIGDPQNTASVPTNSVEFSTSGTLTGKKLSTDTRDSLYNTYLKAYEDYVAVCSNSLANKEERDNKLKLYQEAYGRYRGFMNN